uniref:Uncharacterized protein n=1 Tax=Rhizophora mucronata TaxID=61149 RepID=A0A2P2PSP4_RHIMU
MVRPASVLCIVVLVYDYLLQHMLVFCTVS